MPILSARSFILPMIAAVLLMTGCAAEPVPVGGSRSFDRSLALEDSAATSANISIGDVNADSHLDIVLVKGRHWPLENRVLIGRGDGTFEPGYLLGGTPDRSYTGELTDIDGDGDLDVIVSNDNPDTKRVHLNDGSGHFDVGSTFGDGDWSTRHLSIADLNGDHLPDVVLANRYGPSSGPSYICFGVPGGGFQASCQAFAEGSATTITPVDINGDGSIDLIMPHRDGGQSYMYVNDGNGGFAERRPFGPANAAIRSAKAVDLDADGILDLVVIYPETGPALLRGLADGAFAPEEPLGPPDLNPYALEVEDLDQDGHLDIIVGYIESRPIVFYNDGTGVFDPVPFGDDEGSAYGFDFGDLNEDGYLDIGMARSGAINVLYFGGPAIIQ